jgi:hypothetical protein
LVRLATQAANDATLQPGQNTFPFDPTAGPGYVWHCHILDHEDNDMMRPMVITFKDLPSLNSASIVRKPANATASESAPATANPAHNHHGYDQNGTTTTPGEQKGNGSLPLPEKLEK